MNRLIEEVRVEYDTLASLVQGLEPAQWKMVTPFFSWTIADQIMHLVQVDEFGLLALHDEEKLADTIKQVRANQAVGVELSQIMRENLGGLSSEALLERWRETYHALLAQFEASAKGRKIPWFGPPMRVESFAAARQMEVWAHGQDIYDTLRRVRKNRESIRNICNLGVRTQEWSFRNRGLQAPGPPRVILSSPGGGVWSWNDTAVELIAGAAEDFALVVTQRRHVADTGLHVEGEGAQRWMEIAQCFAGAAQTGPAPGERVVTARHCP